MLHRTLILIALLLGSYAALAQSSPPGLLPPTGNGSGLVVQAPGSSALRTLTSFYGNVVNVKNFAGGDGILVKGAARGGIAGTATASSTAFSSSAVTWTAADAGSIITIDGAGPGGAPLSTTIASVTDANDIVLANAASTSTPTTFATTMLTVATAQSGGGSYAPGDQITLAGGTGTPITVQVRTTTVTSATVNAAGTALSGTTGPCVLTGTTGTTANTAGRFTVNAVLVGGQISTIGTIVNAGLYSANPTSLSAEPVTGCGLTSATLTLTMGVVSTYYTNQGAYTALPSNPVSQASTTGSGTGATFNIGVTGQTGTFRYGHDDSAGIAAAMTYAASLASTQPTAVYFPPGNYLIRGTTLPTFTRVPVGIVGDGAFASNIQVDAAYSGSVFSWDEVWGGSGFAYAGTSLTRLPMNAGPDIHGISITGDRNATTRQDAFNFIDRAQYVTMDDVKVFYLNGSAIRSGQLNLTTESFYYESHFTNLTFFNDGGTNIPVIDLLTTASVQTANEDHFIGVDIYAPQGPGVVIRNNNPNTTVRSLWFIKLRVEGQENNPTGLAGDNIQIGSTTDTGAIHGVYFTNLECLSSYFNYSCLHLTASGTSTSPQGIDVQDGNFNGTNNGNPIKIDYGGAINLHINGMYSIPANIVVAASTQTNAPIVLDGGGQESTWTYSIDSSVLPFFAVGHSRYGLPTPNSIAPVVAQQADQTVNYGLTRGNLATDWQTCRFNANQVAIGTYATIAGGCNNRTTNSGCAIGGGNQNLCTGFNASIAGGANNTLGGNFSSAAGYLDTDRGNYGGQYYASGDFFAQGDAQAGHYVLRCSTNTTSACTLTASNSAIGTSNCANISVNNAAYGLRIALTAFDITNLTNGYTASWGYGSAAPHLLTRASVAATTLLDGVTTAVSPDNTRSYGTTTGVGATATADTTNACAALAFTPPTGNTATWNAVATVDTVETTFSVAAAANSITLSGTTFAGGSPSGTTVGVASVVLSSAAFKGTLSITGTNASSFQILNGTTLATNGVVGTGSYSINLVATQAGAAASPFSVPFTIVGQ